MENIFHRVSIRKYEDKPVEKEKILQILKAGMQAPSACNQQPWEFYVLTDKEKIRELSKATPYSGCAAGCDRSGISERGTGCAGHGADRHVYRPGKYLAGNGCAGTWRRLDRNRADAGSHGSGP